MFLYWLNKLPGQQRHKTNELHRDKPDNISWSYFSPNIYMYSESYSGLGYQYRNIPLRLTSRYNLPYSYDHHMNYQNNWNNIYGETVMLIRNTMQHYDTCYNWDFFFKIMTCTKLKFKYIEHVFILMVCSYRGFF